MDIEIREYTANDLPEMIEIWNEIVDEGVAFPQVDRLTGEEAERFFAGQSFTAAAVKCSTGEVVGLYILHPNNVGRCGHISNTSYGVKSSLRGHKIGGKLVAHSIEKSRELGFKILQFNAVVKTNHSAIHLYEKLGFIRLGVIPEGFMIKDGTFEDIILFYLPL